MNNETWKDDILNSMRAAKRAEPNPFLFTRIQSKLEGEISSSSRLWKLATVLSFTLLALNVSVILWNQKTPAETSTETSSYFIETPSYQLY